MLLATTIHLTFDRLTPIRRLATATFHGLLGHVLADTDPEAVRLFFKPGHDGDALCPYVLQPLHLREHMAESLALRLITFDPEGACIRRFIAALPACANRSFGESGALVTAAHADPVCRVERNPHHIFHANAVVRVALISPAVITHHKKPVNPSEFSLPIFVTAALRRLADLATTFSLPFPTRLDPLDVLGNAHLGLTRLRWVAPRRRSSSQNADLSLGGLVGFFDIHHASDLLYETLLLLHLTNIGKKTSCGCGTLSTRIIS